MRTSIFKSGGGFKNYLKAGNSLASTDENAFARVKYDELEVSH